MQHFRGFPANSLWRSTFFCFIHSVKNDGFRKGKLVSYLIRYICYLSWHLQRDWELLIPAAERIPFDKDRCCDDEPYCDAKLGKEDHERRRCGAPDR